MNIFPIIRFRQQHKFVRMLKKFLDELVVPNPNLPDNDLFDDQTLAALRSFKEVWYKKFYIGMKNETWYDISPTLWGIIGRVLDKGVLLRELRQLQDYELRNLLLGMEAVNSMKVTYTKEMKICDAKVASIVGGENAVAAANGFDPESLVLLRTYKKEPFPYYRIKHLDDYVMHLYGSTNGTRFGVDGKTYTDIYIPDGFEPHSKSETGGKKNALTQIPSPTESIVTFYYKKLGSVEDVTFTLMHVKDFNPVKQGNRWHIGQIGGKGGAIGDPDRPYLHSHFALLKGDVGLSIKYSKNGGMDVEATYRYRESIGVRFIDAFC